MNIPEDILIKIDELFPNNENNSAAKTMIEQIYRTSFNVGQDQLARSLLFISEGDVAEIKRIIDCNYYGDPRDVIMEAEQKSGNPGHYFIHPFD